MKLSFSHTMVYASVLTLVSVMTACKPLCRVEIPNSDSYKFTWYGPELTVKHVGSWTRVDNYSGKSVYFEEIDLDLLKDCKPCDPIREKMKNQYDKAKDTILTSKLKSLKLTQVKNKADLIAHLKIGYVKEQSPFLKFIGHLALFGPPEDVYKLMVKLVDKNSNKIIFGYCFIGTYNSTGDFDMSMRALEEAIDDFNRSGRGGFWFTDCP